MVNLRRIAQMAGVSKSTVSRVINNEKYVSDALKKKVEQAIEETGYVPNGNAVKLSKGKNYTLGVTVPYNNSCYDQLVNSILYQARKMDYQVLLLPTYYDEKTESSYLSLIEKKIVDGLILTSRTIPLKDLEKRSLKGKIVSTEKVDSTSLSMIYPDRKRIYDQLFLAFSKQKKARVVFTTKRSPRQSQSANDKRRSYETYFGKAIEGRDYFTGIEGYEEGLNWAIETFTKHPLANLLYVNGDDTAAGVITGLKKINFSHKKDYQIIGEGNLPYSKILDFSTIDFLPAEIGKAAVDFILSDADTIVTAKKPLLIKRSPF